MVEATIAWKTADGHVFRDEQAAILHEDAQTIKAMTQIIDEVIGYEGAGKVVIEVLTKQLCEDRHPDHQAVMDRFVGILVRKHDLAWRPYDHVEGIEAASEREAQSDNDLPDGVFMQREADAETVRRLRSVE